MRRFLLASSLLLAVACHEKAEERADVETIQLDVDIRDHAELRIERRRSELNVILTPSRGFGVTLDAETLSGRGTLERFPEADVVLYTAKLASPPVPGGPCGEQPISLALALHRRGAQSRVSGSLTPYCGKDVWSGIPARNPLRLSTSVPEPE